jgi:acyl-CoA synthetase (AMP-forming)/AMP-acid ligase II
MHLQDIYIDNAADRGADPALTYTVPPFAGLTLTWSDLIDRSEALAENLSGTGVGAGSRVATVLADHPNVIPALLAMWRLDAIPVLIDPEWGESILARSCPRGRPCWPIPPAAPRLRRA